jgi:hypothetical protein
MGVVYRALGGAFGLAERVVPDFLLPSTAPEALIAASGADPDPSAREGLRRLLDAIAADSELSFFGKVSLRWDPLRIANIRIWRPYP